MKKLAALSSLVALAACSSPVSNPTPEMPATDTPASAAESNTVTMETSKGTITVALSDLTPATTANFKKLVEAGFYDGLTFHRYEPGFVIQGGDPRGDGTGGSDEMIPLEIPCADGALVSGKTADCAVALPHKKHTIAMARSADPNSASSQFYFTLEDVPFLDGKYAAFGTVTEGSGVVDALRVGDTIVKAEMQK